VDFVSQKIVGITGSMGNFMSFVRDLIADCKSSRRFQVGLVLWIPLIIVTAIMVVRFGIRHTLSQKFGEIKTTFIQENSVHYPDLLLYFRNPPQGPKLCFQWIQGQPSPMPVYPATCPANVQPQNNDPNRPPLTCWMLPLHLDVAVPPQNGMPWANPIFCNFTFNPNANGNDNEMYLITPGGFNTSSQWNFGDPHFLRPNHRIGVDLFHELFFAFNQRIDNWFARVVYEDSVFPDNYSPYWVGMEFRIPFTNVEVNWQDDGFDSWMLLAAWGGGIFFFYLLHIAAFAIAKFFLPDDSRLLRGAVAAEGSSAPLIS